jgi:hypothetical protein
MSQQGGKVNKSLKDWVSFVKKVQKEEKLSYKDAIIRAKARKDKGEKWMSGGDVSTSTPTPTPTPSEEVIEETEEVTPDSEKIKEKLIEGTSQNIAGGKRTRRRHRSNSRGRSARKSRSARRSRSRARR